ncbi:MAG: threonine--tRNA ligase [bacterium]
MIKITFPDGAVREYQEGVTPMDVAKSISEGLARNVLAAKVNGKKTEASTPITTDAELTLYTWRDTDGKEAFWHSSAHLLAEAVQAFYPKAKFGIGPAIENGFYYDIDFGDETINAEALQKIEAKMKELAKANNPYVMSEVSKADAVEYFTKKGDNLKLDLIEGLEDGDITFCTQGSFTDLCKGFHVPSTGYIKAIKLLNIAGAYWRGDENNQQLTRIYGITFPKNKELEEYLHMLEEAKRRDHRKLGKELELFTFSDKVGQGLPMWLPKGALIRDRLSRFMQEAQTDRGYVPVITPHIGKKELYVTSGHYEKYGEDSFRPIKTPDVDEEFLLKPMNCPHHCEVYKYKPHSYKDLPLRFAEFGTVYRYEQSGELNGLTRVRGFTQDDAHIFCRPDQVIEEFNVVIDLVQYVFTKLGFKDYTAQISLRDKEDRSKYIGNEDNWEKAEQAIIEAAESKGLKTVTEYGEAAFYGPKLDFMVKDALGRQWQLGTIQVDYNLPERFELEYIGEDNKKHRPVMIHRAPFGSLERFFAILTEHCAGNFPLWLSPEQIAVLPISDKFSKYANDVLNYLKKYDIRGFVDERAEKIGKKIRDAEVSKVPFMLIVGEKEVNDEKVSVRKHGEGDVGTFSLTEFTTYFNEQLDA